MSFLIENGILKRYVYEYNQTDVIIPDGVTSIGERAFQYANNIVTVTVPGSVKIIGNYAFSDCVNLIKVTLPESIIHIGEYAFSKCGKLSEINTLGRISRIHPFTFYECSSLASVTIPEGVTYIGENAFNHCIGITSLKLPDNLEVIDSMAFSSCENLADFSIPPKVTHIGYYALVGCKKLYEITLPCNLRAIEEGAFAGCEGLAEIRIPYGVTIIKNSAFNSCVNLSKVTIPSSVARIEMFAFYNCRNLRKLTIPQNGMEIMLNAFFQCDNLVTNISIKKWDKILGIEKMDYALHYMRCFETGDPFYENTKEENKAYIRHQLCNILKRDINSEMISPNYSQAGAFAILPDDTNVIVFLTNEIPLRIDEVEILLDKVQGNPEASAILLDYRNRNFTEDFLEKYENDKLQKELGLKERTAAEWRKIFRLGSDGEGGYIILGYKGKDVDVEIPEKIGKKPVTAIADMAFSLKEPYISHEIRNTRYLLETVIIPDSVTAIGSEVFAECRKLNSIVYRGKTFTPNEFEDYCVHNVPKPIVSIDD